MAIGNMHKKFGKNRVCGSWQTDTDVLITNLRNCSRRHNKHDQQSTDP